MNEVSSMLSRMKELNVQKLNGTYSTGDKDNIGQELNELGAQIDSIDRIQSSTESLLLPVQQSNR